MENLSFREYQIRSKTFAEYPKDWENPAPIYPYLGLTEEAGEVAGKMAKVIRDKRIYMTPDEEAGILAECGDVLWNLSQIVNDLGYDLEDVARDNLTKLKDRKERGVIKGTGDKR